MCVYGYYSRVLSSVPNYSNWTTLSNSYVVIQVVSNFCLLIINIKGTENLDNDVNDSLEMYPSCNAVGYDVIHWKPNINDKKFSPFEEEQWKDGQELPAEEGSFQLIPSISSYKVSRKLFGPFRDEAGVPSTFILSENDSGTLNIASGKNELLQLKHTQFPSLGIFVGKKVGNWINWD